MAPVPEEEETRTVRHFVGWRVLLLLEADTRRLYRGWMRQHRCCITAPAFKLNELCQQENSSFLFNNSSLSHTCCRRLG